MNFLRNIIGLMIIIVSLYLYNQYHDEQLAEQRENEKSKISKKIKLDETVVLNEEQQTSDDVELLKKTSSQLISIDEKIKKLKAELNKFKLPQKVEVLTFTKKFQNEISEIKKIKIQYDKEAPFYISIQLFSDDTDETSPLVIQIRIKDVNSDLLVKEESYNW